MGSQLERILPTVINRGYKNIYILDDASTDNSEQVASKYKKHGVIFVKASTNKGAGANRNRVLDYQSEGIVHFLDADVTLKGKHQVTNEINKAFDRHPDAGAIGFRVFNSDGTQYDWNFGPKRKLIDGVIWQSFDWYEKTRNKNFKKILKKLFCQRWNSFWTYTHLESAEKEQQVGAVVECNFAVKLDDFLRVNGFDDSLRFHEIHSLALKLDSINRSIWYIPALPVYKFDEVEVRTNRKQEYKRSRWLLDYKRLTGKYNVKKLSI